MSSSCKNKETIYSKTQDILKAAESALIKARKPKYKIIDLLQRHCMYPLLLFMEGLTMGAAIIPKFLGLFSIILITFAIIGKHLSPEESMQLFFMLMSLLLLIIIFTPPSIFSGYGINEKLINATVEGMGEIKINNSTELSSIKGNIDLLYSRGSRKISILRGIIALLWAAYLYIFTKVFDYGIGKNIPPEKYDASGIAILLIIIIFIYFIVETYSTVYDLVFHSAKIACNEIAVKLEAKGQG